MEEFLRPIFMGCTTKSAKAITIARGSLQRLISLRAVFLSAVFRAIKLHESRTAIVSSTVAATPRQLVMFVVNKVIEEDRRLLYSSELESITLTDRTAKSLRPAARDAFSNFEDLCLLGNGERP